METATFDNSTRENNSHSLHHSIFKVNMYNGFNVILLLEHSSTRLVRQWL